MCCPPPPPPSPLLLSKSLLIELSSSATSCFLTSQATAQIHLQRAGLWILMCVSGQIIACMLYFPAPPHPRMHFFFSDRGNIAQILFNSAGLHPLSVQQDSLAQQWLLLLSYPPKSLQSCGLISGMCNLHWNIQYGVQFLSLSAQFSPFLPQAHAFTDTDYYSYITDNKLCFLDWIRNRSSDCSCEKMSVS